MPNPIYRTKLFITCCTLLMASLTYSISYAYADISFDNIETLDWNLRRDRKGVQVYTARLEGSSYMGFKAVTVIDSPIEHLMAVFADPASCMDWLQGCTKSHGLDYHSFNHRFAYSVNNLPWPFQSRDYVLEIMTQDNPATGVVVVNMRTVADKVPEERRYVRVDQAYTRYVFTPVSDTETEVVWYQHTEPEGILPAWLVNFALIDMPYNSMRSLADIAKLEKYQNPVISHDKEGYIQGIRLPNVETHGAEPQNSEGSAATPDLAVEQAVEP